jgi:hypothetical protein
MSVTTNIAGIGAKRKLEMVLRGTVSSFLASKMVEYGNLINNFSPFPAL